MKYNMTDIKKKPWCWYIYLENWVIFGKGKCWDSYSSTMGCIWVMQYDQTCVNLDVYDSGVVACHLRIQ